MNIYDILKKLNIKYEEEKHNAVHTIEEAKKLKLKIKGTGTKSLFLKNKNNYYLVILEENKRLDFKKLYDLLKIKHLSFASDIDLEKILNLKEGITPFGIIEDKNNLVTIIIDKELKDKILLFHPNEISKTLSISYEDLIKFTEYEKHTYIVI